MKSTILLAILLFSLTSNAQSLISMPTPDEDKKRFFLFGTTAVSTTDELVSSIQGSQKFLCMLRLKNQEAGNGFFNSKLGLDVSVGVNAINLKPTGIAKDSFDLVSLMFPETGNFGITMTIMMHHYLKVYDDSQSTFRISSEFSGALRQNKVSNILINDSVGNITGSETIDFSVLNWNIMPFKFTYTYKPKNEDLIVNASLGFYFNHFNIPNEDVNSFNKLFASNPIFLNPYQSGINSVGGKLTLSINGYMFYADLRQNARLNNFVDNDNPFKGFVFNAGFATNLIIFSK